MANPYDPQHAYAAYRPDPTAPTAPPRRRRRVFLWVFLVIQALFIAWLVSGIVGDAHGTCSPDLTAHACAAAKEAGGGIAVLVIVFVWMFVDVALGVGYGIYRLSRRPR